MGKFPQDFKALTRAAPTGDLARFIDDAALDGMFVTDGTTLLAASRSFARLLGFGPGELSGTPLLARFHEDVRQWFEELIRTRTLQVLKEPQVCLLLCRDGETRREVLLRLRCAPYLGPGMFVGAVSDVTNARRSERALRNYARRLRLLSQQVFDVQEKERRNLARELHDEIGQQLTMVKLTLGRIALEGEARRDLDEAMDVVNALMRQVRALSLDLRPSMLDDLGLVPTLRWYVDRVARLASVRAELEIGDAFPRLRPEIETVFFRVAQEAITNVIRHAGARTLRVGIFTCRDVIELRVEDDGVGFDPVEVQARALQGRNAGITGMQERAALAGAQLEFEPRPGGGTCLRMHMLRQVATRNVAARE